MRKKKLPFLFFGLVALFTGCFYDKEELLYPAPPCDPTGSTYSATVSPIISSRCVSCHGSPLTPTAVPKSENFDKISLNRSLEIYKERLGNMNGMEINIVGSFKEEEIIPLIEKYIASLPSSNVKTGFTDNKLRQFKGKNEFTFYKGKEEKSSILAVYGGEMAYTPEMAMLTGRVTVFSEILSISEDRFTENPADSCFGTCVTCHNCDYLIFYKWLPIIKKS